MEMIKPTMPYRTNLDRGKLFASLMSLLEAVDCRRWRERDALLLIPQDFGNWCNNPNMNDAGVIQEYYRYVEMILKADEQNKS